MEIPHFAALRGTERELVILRSETGESWREHHCEHTEEELNQILNGMDEGECLPNLYKSHLRDVHSIHSNSANMMRKRMYWNSLIVMIFLQNWTRPRSWRRNGSAASSREISHNTLQWCPELSRTAI